MSSSVPDLDDILSSLLVSELSPFIVKKPDFQNTATHQTPNDAHLSPAEIASDAVDDNASTQSPINHQVV